MKAHVRKDDTVLIIAGDDKGRKGKVLKVYFRRTKSFSRGY